MIGARGSGRSEGGWTSSWDTGTVPGEEQFAYWREVVWQAFLPLVPERSEAGPFAGTIRGRPLGPLTIARIGSQAQRVCRSPELIARGAGDSLYLNLQLSGAGEAEQDGRRVRQRPGDMAAVDSTRPFELAFGGDFEQLSVGFPLELLGPRLALPQAAAATLIAGDSGLGTMIAGQLRLLARAAPALDDEATTLLAEQLTTLLALALGRAATLPRSAGRALLLQAALDEVEKHLADPSLSPSRVARHVNVSNRYLQRLFADQGTTFARWLLTRRLECARRDLATAALAHLTIGQIAERRGFANRSHFSRAFRAHYGITPREHRVQAVRGPR
ncbi:MAG TPA: helix-turn-helix domain-containing protein [Solirubrobacterales bacterium]|nr:helix-turn-helix domain-containing protein [Solirubrobacterales bacterium]